MMDHFCQWQWSFWFPILAVQEKEPAPITYSDGDGSSYAQAVVIHSAEDEEAGIKAERAWLEKNYPAFRKGRQSLMASGGKHYDLIEFTTAEGQAKSVYFDITDFFGK
ncbi:MAG: hypothetical protein JWR26_434 [Pedosphaera sp.]|nr:hypothetical protein [Pedosphaera sp.]